jgi:hypothetical protein
MIAVKQTLCLRLCTIVLVNPYGGSWRVRGELCVGPADQVQRGAYGGTLDREKTLGSK